MIEFFFLSFNDAICRVKKKQRRGKRGVAQFQSLYTDTNDSYANTHKMHNDLDMHPAKWVSGDFWEFGPLIQEPIQGL